MCNIKKKGLEKMQNVIPIFTIQVLLFAVQENTSPWRRSAIKVDEKRLFLLTHTDAASLENFIVAQKWAVIQLLNDTARRLYKITLTVSKQTKIKPARFHAIVSVGW